jgi:hypothetical protein
MNAENKRKLIIALLAFAGVFFFFRALHAQPVNIEAAKKEGRVVVYGAVPPQSMDGLFGFANGGGVQKAERRFPQDLLWEVTLTRAPSI